MRQARVGGYTSLDPVLRGRLDVDSPDDHVRRRRWEEEHVDVAEADAPAVRVVGTDDGPVEICRCRT